MYVSTNLTTHENMKNKKIGIFLFAFQIGTKSKYTLKSWSINCWTSNWANVQINTERSIIQFKVRKYHHLSFSFLYFFSILSIFCWFYWCLQKKIYILNEHCLHTHSFESKQIHQSPLTANCIYLECGREKKRNEKKKWNWLEKIYFVVLNHWSI